MEKNKKRKIMSKILATVTTFVVLASTVVTFASASDTTIGSAFNRTDLSPSIPLRSIRFTDVYTTQVAYPEYLVSNPFLFFDVLSDEERTGRSAISVNIPYQEGEFTSSRIDYQYEYELYTSGLEGYDKMFSADFPLYYANGNNSTRLRASSYVFEFDDFVTHVGDNDYFEIEMDCNFEDVAYNPAIWITFGLTSPVSDDNGNVDFVTENYMHRYEGVDYIQFRRSDILYILSLYNEDYASGELQADDLYITGLEIVCVPSVEGNQPVLPDVNNSLTDLHISGTLDNYRSAEYDVSAYFASLGFGETRFIGIGDISLTSWLGTAIGGFFDFEIMPNVTLGGIGLVFVGIALFMLVIRIYRG